MAFQQHPLHWSTSQLRVSEHRVKDNVVYVTRTSSIL